MERAWEAEQARGLTVYVDGDASYRSIWEAGWRAREAAAFVHDNPDLHARYEAIAVLRHRGEPVGELGARGVGVGRAAR